jgi:ubiquinone biosynthesis protein COQ4
MQTTPALFRDPHRPLRRFRPFKAMGHFRKLIADKEDTAQVFLMDQCLPSKRFTSDARAFCASDQGRKLMASEPFLPDLLDDHATLSKLPQGSVAHAYMAFMRAEGLTAAGLVAESEKPFEGRPDYDDQLGWFSKRLRDTHDLVHILTGYGRDALGEQCALGFSSAQYPGLTDFFLAWAGAYEVRRRIKTEAPVLAAVGEARRTGKGASKLYAQDIRALLAEPLEAARARMKIATPTQYGLAHQHYRERGIDPYNFLTAVA